MIMLEKDLLDVMIMRGAGINLHREICSSPAAKLASPSPCCNKVGKKYLFPLRPRHFHGELWLHRSSLAEQGGLMLVGKACDSFDGHGTHSDNTRLRPHSFQAVFDTNLNDEPPEQRYRGKEFSILADLMSAQASNSRALLDELKSAPLTKDLRRAYDDTMPTVTKGMGYERRFAAPTSFRMDRDDNRRKSIVTSPQQSAKILKTKGESEIAPVPFADRWVKKKSASSRSVSPTSPLQNSSSANRHEVQSANRHKDVFIVKGHYKSMPALENSFSQSYKSPKELVGKEKHGQEMATATDHDKASLHTSSLHLYKSSEESGSGNSEEKQPLRGQEILLALQRAALEKAKRKQTSAKAIARGSRAKQSSPPQIELDWKNARPIAIKTEWASQIEDLERRIKELKENLPT